MHQTTQGRTGILVRSVHKHNMRSVSEKLLCALYLALYPVQGLAQTQNIPVCDKDNPGLPQTTVVHGLHALTCVQQGTVHTSPPDQIRCFAAHLNFYIIQTLLLVNRENVQPYLATVQIGQALLHRDPPHLQVFPVQDDVQQQFHGLGVAAKTDLQKLVVHQGQQGFELFT